MSPTIFSPEALQKIVLDTLPTDGQPNEKVVVGTVDHLGAQVVASFKFREDRWELQAAARHDWTGEDSVGAKVLLRW